ncbi:conserved hypothetical protein [Ricinus communis]|uniref:Uncharacterized protein n=1 Tax=Ricinus communis TaxID=3988 RepID=B9REV5_RICCO|nr:conserved hypothetical protein [Ricinus communis]
MEQTPPSPGLFATDSKFTSKRISSNWNSNRLGYMVKVAIPETSALLAAVTTQTLPEFQYTKTSRDLQMIKLHIRWCKRTTGSMSLSVTWLGYSKLMTWLGYRKSLPKRFRDLTFKIQTVPWQNEHLLKPFIQFNF